MMRGDDDADSSTPLSAARDGDGSPTIDAAVAAVASILVVPEAMASRRDSGCVGFAIGGSGGGIAIGGSLVCTGDGDERHCASCIVGAYIATRKKRVPAQELVPTIIMPRQVYDNVKCM